jgi:acyl-CoA synthetase (AMP-forming)/AMP-acid ligase II
MTAAFQPLAARLHGWAASAPDDVAITILEDGESATETVTVAALADRSRRVASALIARGLAGKPLLLPAPSDAGFVVSLLGCFQAGAIAVPSPVRVRNREFERLSAMARDAGAAAILGPASMAESEYVRGAGNLPFLAIAECEHSAPCAAVVSDPRAPALLQYTSGSIGAPKGVVVTHGNLAANLEMLRAGFDVHERSVFLSWLPLFHDMGLIATLLLALYCGVPCVLMPPIAFYRAPQRWPAAIARHGATISGAPNFAFELCLRRALRIDPAGLDLGGWEVAFCGGEPVRADTMRRFAEALGRFGLRPTSLYPCYGMAEATVFISGGRARQGVKVLKTGVPSGLARPLVGCGQAAEGSRIRIVDPDTRRPAPEGTPGEIWVAGDHIGGGYWNDPAATAEVFEATLASEPDGRYLRTGDIGMIVSGELYIVGRRRAIIIHRGENIHAEDVERDIAASHADFGEIGAAFAIEAGDGEQLIVVHEVAREAVRTFDANAMIEAALKAVADRHGVRLFDLVLVRPGAVPRTSSGKVQREQCREAYRSGSLAQAADAAGHPALGRYQARHGNPGSD